MFSVFSDLEARSFMLIESNSFKEISSPVLFLIDFFPCSEDFPEFGEDFGLKSISTENTAIGCVKKRSTPSATIKEGFTCELCGIDPALFTIKRTWHTPSVVIHNTSLLYSDFFSSKFPLSTFESLHIFTERKIATPIEAHMQKPKINTSIICKGRKAGD